MIGVDEDDDDVDEDGVADFGARREWFCVLVSFFDGFAVCVFAVGD